MGAPIASTSDRERGEDSGSTARTIAFDRLLEGVWVLSKTLRVRDLNAAAARQCGGHRFDVLGRPLAELFPGMAQTALHGALQHAIADGTPQDLECPLTLPDGTTRWYALRVDPVPDGVVLMGLDIGDRKDADEEGGRARRLASVVRFGAGLAHDFNNLLTIILTCAEGAYDACADGTELASDLSNIRWAARQGARITQQLMMLGHGQGMAPVVISVARVVRGVHPRLRELLGAGVRLELDTVAAGAVRLQPGQLEDVLVNLAKNARDAMPSGGTLRIRTRVGDGPSLGVPSVLGAQSPAWVEISVTDTGAGIPIHLQDRVFDPYFTTKGPRHGTGLGLASVHSTAAMARGCVALDSREGEGTTISVFLPRVAGGELKIPRTQVPATVRKGGGETVLLVDQNAGVRQLFTRELVDRGYTVLGADDAADALRFAERYSGAIHTVVAEHPAGWGAAIDLVAALRQRRPRMGAVFVTHGSVPSIAVALGVQAVSKPLSVCELEAAVRQSIDERAVIPPRPVRGLR